MRQLSSTTGGNYRNAHALCHSSGKCQVITLLGAVSVHTGKQYFSRPHLLCGSRPFHGIHAHIHPTAVFINIPTAAVCSFFRIDCHNHTLTAKFLCCITDQSRIHDSCGIHRNLVSAFSEDCFKIIYRTNTTADRKRDKHLTCHLTNPFQLCRSAVSRCRNIQKYDFIRTGRIICRSHFGRIAGIPEIHKINAFYYSAVFDIQTGNYSLCMHIIVLPAYVGPDILS